MVKLNHSGVVQVLILIILVIGVVIGVYLSQKPQIFTPKAQDSEPKTEAVPDEILVKFKLGVDEESKGNIKKHFGLEERKKIPQIEVEVLGVNEHARDKVIEALNKNPRIEYAEPNPVVKLQDTPNDQYLNYQWNLPKINAQSAWDISKGSSSVVISVIDSGVNSSHPDLIGKFKPGYNFKAGNTNTTDENGHGTGVSGVVAALTNNSIGVASVGREIMALPVKIFGTGTSTGDLVASSIIYSADNGAKVINMSLGGSGSCPLSWQNAVNYAWNKGLVLVAASGNGALSAVYVPAACNNVIAVGATDEVDAKASFSNYGSMLDVMAPGTNILTTYQNDYSNLRGTSFASPQVAALAGLIFSAKPTLTNQQVVDIINSTADDLGSSGWDNYYGWGRINVTKALQKATGITTTPDITPPITSVTSPTSGATVSGVIDIQASASDNVGVTKVEFFVDGQLFATDVTSPYLASWDTTAFSNSSHTLNTKAYDGAGNPGTSAQITVNIQNPVPDKTPPIVSVTSPVNGSIVSGTVNITASASDNVAVSSVSFLVDGNFIGQALSTPYSVTWDTKQYSNGSYTIQAKTLDSSNNIGESAVITITVNDPSLSPSPSPSPSPLPLPSASSVPSPSSSSTDTTPPSIAITSPVNGATVSRRSALSIQANATDNVAVAKVEFYISSSSTLLCADTYAPYTCLWNVPGKPNAKYTLTTNAYDSSGNTASNSVTVTAK